MPPEQAIHRRDFLARAAAVGCGVGGLALASAGPGSAGPDPELARYAGSVGTRFRLRGASGADCPVVLERVEELAAPARGRTDGRAPFSLTFRAPAGERLPQDVYRLDHPTLGRADLLLVPVGRSRAGTAFEAVFA